ncbi:tripartite tricarboxylate transporter substrate binding protein [Variovorax sp. Sphag1AA]|uniref:Bug family tripartite tricarboxylate transporter substrate binding protein n=1 Tax=Variovorax sp. Sphag1AA TaxID=2587027 RepID=UPI00161C3781|nr:tripartite tricarboxylate transporter substrate binding protein [Variovorax sp. Sphag1AA]MBB3176851.1 tripartite-type tricarboxylate transporter receptor subunit TctC [Variovorax sp. Sphag1AA]
MRQHLTRAVTAFALGLGIFGAVQAETPWPTKPIRIVVGFAPGGSTDVMARILAQQMTESLGQTIVIDNKPGASGNIAAAEVIRAAPDGQTFLIAPTSVETANPSLFKSSILPSRDLTPVGTIGRTQMYLVAKPQLPVNNAKELVALAKSQPGKLSYASSGTGTPPHLACEMFKVATGTYVTHIPYRGAAPALQDVMAGHADFVCDPGIAFPHIRSGKVKLLGVVSAKRSPFFPDVPTVGESGFKEADLDIWFGLWAPNGTSPEIVARLNRELGKAMTQAAVKSRYAELGAETAAMSPTEFKALLADESQRLSTLIREQKIVVE